MRVKWAAGQIFSRLVVVMFFGAGLLGLWAGWDWSQKYESWKTYQLMQGPVDISAPGEFEFQYVQNAKLPHGAMIWLKLSAEGFENQDPEALLEPLHAAISITGEKGVSGEFERWGTECSSRLRNSEGMIPLLRLPLVGGKGTHSFKLVIHQGVPALKGVPQQVVGRYELCGCEAMPISMYNFIGGTFIVFGGLIALCLYRDVRGAKGGRNH